jgi:hypothetical protein
MCGGRRGGVLKERIQCTGGTSLSIILDKTIANLGGTVTN